MNTRRLVKSLIPPVVFEKVEPTGHLLESVLFALRYGFPGKKLKIIGVTGTNGKTTTSFMIHKMLTGAGYKVALMTTVASGVGNDIVPQAAHMTTISAPALQKSLKQYVDQGVEWLVLETTSHALAQHRVWGVDYQIAVMTNVTHEHLDYHKTFERYVRAKRMLFDKAAKHKAGFGVINADDPSAKIFIDAIKYSETYGLKEGRLKASDIELRSDGSSYQATAGSDSYQISCQIPGEFNVYNSLAAVSVGRHLGLDRQQIEQGIAALDGVEGRMMTINEGQPYSVVVDFAHTPDSFERLLGDLRAGTKGKLIVLFGSAGRRDESKRAIQGQIAGKYADEVVLTEEDDRDIDGNEILAQIASGTQEAGKIKDKDMFLIRDRSEAIQFAMTRAKQASDCVVLLGKGHEKTIERADGEHPWDEVKEARRALNTHDFQI